MWIFNNFRLEKNFPELCGRNWWVYETTNPKPAEKELMNVRLNSLTKSFGELGTGMHSCNPSTERWRQQDWGQYEVHRKSRSQKQQQGQNENWGKCQEWWPRAVTLVLRKQVGGLLRSQPGLHREFQARLLTNTVNHVSKERNERWKRK